MLLVPLDSFEVPELIRRGLLERGYRYLTPPQAEALRGGLLEGANLVVVAPTASGKTLVGEMALINSALGGFKGVYTTPLKALAYEKFEELRFWERFGLRVAISMGDYEVTDEEVTRLGYYDVVVTTYERLDSIMRRRPQWLREVGALVIDELHMLGDRSRGHIVEMVATRAKLVGAQIVGLSATVGNGEELARWLSAKLVRSDWRPVKLYEVVAYRSGGEYVLVMPPELEGARKSVKDLTEYWLSKALAEGFNVLEFKYSRRAVEELAAKYSQYLCKNLPESEREGLVGLVKRMKEELPDFEFEKLEPLVRCGASYHHAGLTAEARRIIEGAFRDRLLKYVAATPTLAMGVNLPARVVIINCRYYSGRGLEKISVLEYKQLAGRAGRPQYDPYGIVVVGKDLGRQEEASRYVKGRPEPITSTILERDALRKHVLAVVVSGEAQRLSDLVTFFSNTFGALSVSRRELESRLRAALELLVELAMVTVSGSSWDPALAPTRIGRAASWLYIDPLTAALIIEGLREARRASELYYLTLVGMAPELSDFSFSKAVYEWVHDVAEELESQGLVPPRDLPTRFGEPAVEWLRGVAVGLLLRDWVNEVPERAILERYGIDAGDLRVLKENGEWLVHAASVLSRVAGLEGHARALEALTERVRHGVKEELLELVKVRYVGRVRARALAEHGIRGPREIVERAELVIKLLGEGWGKRIVEEALKMVSNQA